MAITEKLRLNGHNLAERLSFLKLGDGEVQFLGRLDAWMTRRAPLMARHFYDFQFSHPASRRFFEHYAGQRMMSLDKLRLNLESAQADYLRDITAHAAAGGFDMAYMEKRLRIGQLHNDIGLPMKLYLGSYSLHFELIDRQLRRDFWYRPFFRRRARALLERVLLLDIQAVTDGFMIDMLETLELSDSIAIDNAQEDVTDHVSAYKQAMRDMLGGIRETAGDLGDNTRTLGGMIESLSSASQQEAAAIEEMNATLEGIENMTRDNLDRARHAANTATGENDERHSAVGAMREISRSSQEITSIVDMINDIAFQTNLLALNAAVEAARAGHEGRGFAVVAAEVKQLSDRTTESAARIRHLIDESTQLIDEGNGYVEQVSEQIREIARALQDQSTSIGEISAAAREIDKTAQSNASESESLSRLASDLGARAEKLRMIVDRH
ncbi:globin-coupled sensor protein [Natronospira bacteriovora]|uniref:Globin-coupled sensor protein n=1 Tax=Natronospira bacteriovora TaxID=3069753 RepID=A0ABU0W6F7_9GAMM|nr:globin-coupled sensor protein [Natronospira sp. AB-CW4]MDQ2068580.1 globin-coupled sensor protein [Natronospira sp. AB-CW4]